MPCDRAKRVTQFFKTFFFWILWKRLRLKDPLQRIHQILYDLERTLDVIFFCSIQTKIIQYLSSATYWDSLEAFNAISED